MLIILESADCCGKTTLINWLQYKYGFKLIYTPRKPGPEQVYEADFDEFLLQRVAEQNKVYLLDRHTPSNYAYGLMRNESATLDYLAEWLTFKNKAEHGLCTIWLTRSAKPIDDDLISLSKEQDNKVLGAYEHLADLASEPMFNLVENKHTYKNIEDYIWQKLQLV